MVVIGSTDSVKDLVRNKLISDFPDIDLRMVHSGYFSEYDENELIDFVARLKPKLVILGKGQPAQEIFAEKLKNRHSAIYLCVGGALDVYVGKVRRAPPFFLALKLEWLYRLILEPSRIKRQVAMPFVIFNLLFSRDFVVRVNYK